MEPLSTISFFLVNDTLPINPNFLPKRITLSRNTVRRNDEVHIEA